MLFLSSTIFLTFFGADNKAGTVIIFLTFVFSFNSLIFLSIKSLDNISKTIILLTFSLFIISIKVDGFVLGSIKSHTIPNLLQAY